MLGVLGEDPFPVGFPRACRIEEKIRYWDERRGRIVEMSFSLVDDRSVETLGIGGGLLGLEAANGLKLRGMDVTVVHLGPWLLERQLDEVAGKMLQKSLEDKGLKFLLQKQTEALIQGESGRVAAIRFKDGMQIPADLVVMAAGIRPNYSLAEKSGTPFVSLAGAVVIIEPVKKQVFKTPHTDRMAAEKVFEDMKKRGITKVALLSETSGFGASGKKETEAVAGKYGITLVANETYGPKDTDMSPQLTKIKGTPGVQAVFVFGLGQGPAIVTKNYKQLGITLPLYQSHGVASDEFLKLAGPAAEGVRLPSPAQLIPAKLPANDPQKPVVTAYENAYKAAYKQDVSTFGGYAYDGLMLAVDAIKRANSTDKAKVRDALEATKGFVATSGTFNMSPTDHMGLDLSAFRMLEVKGGDWVIVQ